jgi:predicted permease
MNPPLWAVLASIIVAVITPLQKELFFNTTGFLHNSVFLAIDTAGAVAIPIILVSLGSSLVKSLETIDTPIIPTEIDIKMENRAISLSLFARMAMVPLLMYPILIPIMHWGITYIPSSRWFLIYET